MTPPPFNLAAFLADEVPAIRERAEKATPGPWELDRPLNPDDISLWVARDDKFLANLVECSADANGLKYHPAFDLQRVEDATFVAASRTDIPRLLEAVEALQALLGECERGLTEVVAHVEEQAKDEGLWAVPLRGLQPISEAYLQQELRKLHETVETRARALLARLRSARGGGKEK